MMKTYMTKILTVLMLMMFSMGASADVKIFYGEKGEELKTGETKIKADNGTIAIEQKASDDGSQTTIYLTFTPNSGYTISTDNIDVYAVISPSSSPTRTPEISGDPLKLTEETSKSPEKRYSVKIDSKLGLWIKKAEFQLNGSKGPNRDVTDYSGIYYIASGGKAQANGNGYTYNSSTPSNNFYLCPTEGWCYYKPDDDFSNDGTTYPNPFLTTYKCRTADYHNGNASDAIWTIEKAPDPNSAYYYIKQTNTGKYLVSNGQIRTTDNPDRIRVHLELIANPIAEGNKVLFEIKKPSGKDYLEISPKGITDGTSTAHASHDKHIWLTVNNGNYNNLVGNSGKTGGPTGYENTCGIVCIYATGDANAPFYLEKATVDPPTFTNNYTAENTFTISAAEGTTIYYTTDGSTPTTSTTATATSGTGTTSVNITQTESMTVIKAIAVGTGDYSYFPSEVATYNIPRCEKPVIKVSGSNITITCATEGATIYYTTNGDPVTTSSTSYTVPFAKGEATTIRAIATKVGYVKSSEAALLPPTVVYSSSQITDMSGNYALASNFTSTGSIGTSDNPFSGTIDGNLYPLELSYPLVAYADGATIKNVILDNVSFIGGSNVGAICNEATGASRIYNCGVLATDSEVESDKDGYTYITNCSSTIGGSGFVGGIVGLLDGSSRVINCFSYANITGGDLVGGIVGKNNVATTSTNLQTMVMNCMFYGDITGGDSKAPIYNGVIISNRSDESGVSNFNYFWGGASYVQDQNIDTYNCALSAETRFLQRFEFFRNLLNSNRELAAWWATDDAENKNEMMKWVLEPSQIGTSTPYPILRMPYDSENHIVKYPSVVNIDAAHAEAFSSDATTAKTQYNQGRKFGTTFTINIQNASSGAPSNANITTSSVTRNITDKDPAHFNFNYYKVQLPYYNEVGSHNYTGNNVVTGWKIVSMSKSAGSFTTGSDASAEVDENGNISLSTPYNFADRKSTAKDIYSDNNKRVFSQGAYFDVPEGVTAITIEPYWGKCVYVSDQYPDVVYDQTMKTPSSVTTVGGGERYIGGNDYNINGSSQTVYTTMATAVSALNPSGTVYDNAIVLVGNVHSLDLSDKTDSKQYTIMSIDLDKDNEPDYSYILRFDGANGRLRVHPVRVDFLNVIGLGMAQKSTGGQGTYNFGIMQPLGWFEVTNTALFRVTQFEYDRTPRLSAPMILHGGVIEQWVTVAETTNPPNPADAVTYYHVGSNVWFKEFHIGAHQDRQTVVSQHPPISVTGGDFDEFYLTGLYNTPNTNYDDNAECYINGGRFGKVAGTGMQGIGNATNHTNGNIIWQIDNADIDEFYAGGMNAAHIAEGDITTVISNSRVDQFCGGPKFGDMNRDKKVVTNATNCTFRTFFGAGYGGNSYNREYPTNKYNDYNYDWNGWLSTVYTNEYKSAYKGVSTRIDYQFIPKSDNTLNVARLFVDYVSFSLATTHNVTSKLTSCTITTSPLGRLDLFSQCIGNFYGGGSLGKVTGNVKSTLTNCTVEGSVFGAGYSATLPTVAVMNNSFQTIPKYDTNSGAYLEAKLPAILDNYTWQQTNTVNSTATAIDKTNHILYTTEDLTALGKVNGTATLNIDGTTTVAGNVYGGGEESNVEENTQVNITGGTIGIGSSIDADHGNVFGGGKGVADNFKCDKAMVGKEEDSNKCEDPGSEANKNRGTKVTISNGQVNGNVYGGGEVGRVEWNTQVTIGTAGDNNNTPTVYGSVFGAGAGKETHGYSALVRGNSTVTVQGKAKVLQNVYGGGEKATVGRYWVKNIPATLCPNDPNETVVPTPPADLPDEMPYKTRRGGKCTVIIQGSSQIGPDDATNISDEAGHVFGGGKGVVPNYVKSGDKANWSRRMVDYNPEKHAEGEGETWDYYKEYTEAQKADNTFPKYVWEYFANKDKYLEFLQTLALVTGTDVTIGGGTVKGNVYGGSESGFVQDDTDVKVTSGTIGISGTTTYGNVFGGGKGLAEFFEAGKVKGNTTLSINDGTINGTVYGGGELGYVGKVSVSADMRTFTWTDSEGNANTTENADNKNTGVCNVTITNGTVNGNVFGAGKGKGDTFWCEKAIAYSTDVNVSGGTLNGNVYGGGEVGRVETNTVVKIGNGAGTEGGTSAPNITGSVFGGGEGLETHGYSALVRGNTIVTVEGNANVGHSVYGGGEIASVGKYGLDENDMPSILLGGGVCTVNVQGYAKVGSDVYGAGKGVDPHFDKDNSDKSKRSRRMIPQTALKEGDVSEPYETGSPFVWHYYQDKPTYLTYLETLALATQPHVTISGNTTIGRSVFGGGEQGLTKGSVFVNIESGTITEDVYGGGALANTNTTSLVDLDGDGQTETVHPTTTVNLKGGTIGGDAYGGGLGQIGVEASAAVYYTQEEADAYNTEHGLSSGDEGYVTTETVKTPAVAGTDAIPATVYGDITVNLGSEGETTATAFHITNYDAPHADVVKSGRVFGCNNLYGSPQGNVIVNIWRTVAGNKTRTPDSDEDGVPDKNTAQNPVTPTYELAAVYGGGNLASYSATGKKASVIIKTCEASIHSVYGGGNAAAVPESDVLVLGAYEIAELFGGGNGKDQYTLDEGSNWNTNPGANVSGNATTLLKGGYIHEAYGGSNSKGTISGDVSINKSSGGVCTLTVEDLYGAGKDADIEGDLIIVMGCSETRTENIYGCSMNANVKGNVELTITSGEYGKVFGGNNKSGAIFGHIVVNIEETGCTPIIIDELYGCGNDAPYSVYGYYQDGTIEGTDKPKYVPRSSLTDHTDGVVTFEGKDHTIPPYADPEVNIISCTRIGKVFGGGYGAGATVYGNPKVNINQMFGIKPDGNGGYIAATELGKLGVDANGKTEDCGVFGGGNQAKVVGNTTINIGTETAVDLHASYDKTNGYTYIEDQTVLGANIKGNVYGGGNLADVTGNTFVNICAKKSESSDNYEAVTEGASGVTIGGTVFGGGKGKEDTFLCEKAMIGENNKGAEIENYPNGNTSVRIGHGTVKGSVYGGGEVGRVEMNTVVEIGYGNGGSETKSPIIEGNVFGAGKGVKTHGYSALVRGNPHVTIQGDTWVKKSVYGGGEIASVARYKVAQSDAEGEPYGVEEGEPYLLENSNCGYCYVTVQGNAEIGTSGMKMYHDGVADDKPDDWGHVFAAGKGVLPETYNFASFSNDGSNRTSYPKRMMLYDPDKYSSDQENKTWEYVDPDHKDTNLNIWEYFNTEEKYFTFVRTLGLATQTYVYIGNDASGATDNPLVYGSVYGGSENGIVQYHTNVYIKSGQIGYGDGETGRYSNWPTEDESFTTSWAECASWVFGLDTNDDSKKDLFAPYDPNANASGKLDEYESGVSTQGGRRIATDGHTYYGNVFGGGSGSVPYYDNLQGKSRYIMSAGQVKGNTNVTITGGHILTNVYGGCEATDVDGTATVTMTGGTIGVPRTDTDIINHPVTGYLFGGGKGDQRVFFNKDTNVKDAVVKVEGGRIYGSVYGGGEDGHVLRNTTVTIGKTGNTGPKIGTSGTSYYDGHVFGGGRGFGGEALTAGNVGGAVTLNILGGDILGSVYGGGRLASVGYGLYLTTETGYGIMRADDEYDGSYTNPSTDEASTFFDKGRGHIIMNISGGTIGNDSEYSYDANSTLTHTKGGNVFAGGMGRMYTLDGTPNTSVDWRKMGCVKSTKLTISGDAVIKSCVYGGGELGQVVGTQKGSETKGTEILIEDGTIGTEIKDGGVTQYTFGSVFGSGYGSDVEDIIVTVDGVETVTKPKLEAGLVKYDTNIDMQGGFVKASIYGGGEMASVGSVTEGESPTVTGSSYVTVSDGSVGIDRVALDGGGYKYFGGATMGNVYGGGSGLRTIVRSGRIMKNATVNISGGRIYHNVYGGGAFGTVGDFNYTVDNTTKKVTAINGLKTTGTGDVTVTITGGTLGTSGRENGMVFGSSRGEVGEERDDWLAWTYDTHVTIGKEDGTGPQINGSVYGGGENGHTWNDAEVIIHGGTIGIPSGEKITMDGIEYDGARFPNRGNVYGGGCGTDDYTGTDGKQYYNPLAGVVYGKATVTMDGGHVVHNVYGAGAMGSVGRFTFDNNSSNTIPDGKPVGLADENTNNGLCYVTISGGKIGMTDMKMKGTANGEPDNFGHVFGAGRGEVKDTTVYVNLPVVGYIKESHVEISGSAFVTGSVYGGGESGHVLGDTYVDIKGGQIGCGEEETAAYTTWNQTSMKECAHWDYSETGVPYDKFSGTDGYTSNGATTATDGHTFYGNVFGGGSGYNPYAAGKWVRSAGLVEGNTNVTISDGHILSSVYGGNEQTDVYGSCTVTMTGGTVGVPRKYDERLAHPVTGNLFGAGKGDKRTLFNTWTNVGSTIVSVSGGTVYGSVFGGGEDGHVIGDAETTISGTETVIGTLGTTGYEGNVFGGGRGSFTALTAGVVGGNVTLNIQGGNILGSVYGGGRLASVGTFFANPKLEDGTTDNPLYGTMQPGDAHGNIRVNISGNSTVIGAVDNGKVKNSLNSIGEVYGGCKGTTDGNLKDKLGVAKSTIVNLLGGTVGNSIYGGGEVGNVGDLGDGEAATKAFAKVNLLGGTVVNVYGGGLGQKNASKDIDAKAYVKGNATVNLNGLEIGDYDSSIPSGIVSPVNDDNTEGLDFYRVGNRANGCVVTGNIFGCNNVNGTPTGHAKVHVFMTTPKTGQLATEYDVSAIYGGGNQADYEPAADDNTEVIIEGCGLTKIQQVYGGGNAAASPGTSVLIKGTELIDEVFGGGNGVSTETFDNPGANVGFHTDKSPYGVGDGKAYVQLMAGTINNVYGGSNSNGDIRGGSVITKPTPEYIKDVTTSCCPELSVTGAIFGGGKNADMRSGAEIVLGCMPTDWISEIYAGAEMADVKGDVSLTLTSGKFGRVFGGNKTSGILDGSITVNIQENGSCDVPLVIGELYGGGNMAAYSIYGFEGTAPRTKAQYDALTAEQKAAIELEQPHASPVVNVHGFTSIGNIYGGGYGADADMYGSPTLNINEVLVDGNKAYQFAKDNSANKPALIDGENVKLYDHVQGKMGVISNVFGGGNAAMVDGNTTVNIGTEEEVYVVKLVNVGASVTGLYTRSKNETTGAYEYTATASGATAAENTNYYEKKDVIGADIRGNVYGGGNEAEVTGNTNVNIGRKVNTSTPTTP